MLVLQLYFKHRVGKMLDDRGHYFNRIFFRQTGLLSLTHGKSYDRYKVSRNPINHTHPVDLTIDTAFPVVVHQGFGFSSIGFHAVPNNIFGVVGPLHQISPTHITDSVLSRGSAIEVINRSALFTRTSGGQTPHQKISIYGKLNHQKVIAASEFGSKHFGLAHIPRISVEDETTGAIRRGDPLNNDAVDKLITHKISRLHDFLSFNAKFGLAGNSIPKHVSG